MNSEKFMRFDRKNARISRALRIIRACGKVNKMNQLCIDSKVSRPTLYRWLNDESEYIDIRNLEEVERNGMRLIDEVIADLMID